MATPYQPPPYGGQPMPPQIMDIARRSAELQIERTKNGCLLFAVGYLLSILNSIGGYAICIGFIGGLLALIGAIMIFLGRTAFTERHQRFTVLAVIFFILALIVPIVMVVGGAMAVVGSGLANNIEGMKQGFMFVLSIPLITSAIGGLSGVLLGHELTNALGRKLLYVAYILGIIGGVIVFALGWGILQDIENLDVISIQNKLNTVQYTGAGIGVISSILVFIAYYFAYSRVSSGKAYSELMGSTPPYMPPGMYPPPYPPRQGY